MSKFLEEVAEDLIHSVSSFEKHICVIPNKRMALFLKRQLQNKSNQAGFLPVFLTTSDLLEVGTPYKMLSGLDASIELFLSYNKVSDEAIDFKEFLSWGSQVLRDFNDIDLYEVDKEQLFSYVSDARAIEVWNVDGSEITPFQERYLKFWKSLEALYSQFKEDLEKKSLAYTGMAYAYLNENFSVLKEKYSEYSFSVIGFNALSRSEKSLFKKIEQEFSGRFYWDTDLFSLEEDSMESALFLRSLVKDFRSYENQFDSRKIAKKIKVVPCAQTVLQGKYVAQELLNIDYKENLETAVLLADENLLIPTLNAFDEVLEAPNVSMGYTIKNTAIYSFVEVLLDLKSRQANQRSASIYYKDINRLFEHELGQLLASPKSRNDLKKQMIKKNIVYCSVAWLESFEINVKLLDFLKDNWSEAFDSNYISKFFLSIKELFTSNEWLNEQLFILNSKLEVIDQYTSDYSFLNDYQVVRKIYKQLLSQEQIDLRGEPLSGVQVMGLLESRGLDFKNVFITSVNEDVFPQSDRKDSFIPYDIKVQFGMPTWKERDAVFAYYFYRAIQRAENVFLCYSEQGGETGGAEKSRFISQLKFEWEETHTVNNQLLWEQNESLILSNSSLGKQVKMSQEIKDKLLNWMFRKVSPSALNTYLDCNMNFYYQYILGLGEIDQIEETISDSTFGSIIHNVLEDLFKSKLNQRLEEEDWDKMLVLYPAMLQKAYEEGLKESTFDRGKNYLSYKVASNYIKRFLTLQKEEWRQVYFEKLQFKGLEQTMESKINFSDGLSANIFGNIDRIDDADGKTRVVDYKSGKVQASDLSVKKIEDIVKKPKAFQLMIYAWLYFRNTGEVPTSAGNISFQNMKDFYLPVKIGSSSNLNMQILDEFEGVLKSLLESMLDEELVFSHTEESGKGKFCQYC